jgi:hypothetical protein
MKALLFFVAVLSRELPDNRCSPVVLPLHYLLHRDDEKRTEEVGVLYPLYQSDPGAGKWASVIQDKRVDSHHQDEDNCYNNATGCSTTRKRVWATWNQSDPTGPGRYCPRRNHRTVGKERQNRGHEAGYFRMTKIATTLVTAQTLAIAVVEIAAYCNYFDY